MVNSLLAARAAGLRGRRVAALLREVLDVGVVAVVEAARLAQPLHEPAVELAVLAEGASAPPTCATKSGLVARQRPRQADRHGRRRRLLLDEARRAACAALLRDLDGRRALLPAARERLRAACSTTSAVAAGDADGQPVPREDACAACALTSSSVIDLQVGDVPERQAAVGVALVQQLRERLLAEVLVVALRSRFSTSLTAASRRRANSAASQRGCATTSVRMPRSSCRWSLCTVVDEGRQLLVDARVARSAAIGKSVSRSCLALSASVPPSAMSTRGELGEARLARRIVDGAGAKLQRQRRPTGDRWPAASPPPGGRHGAVVAANAGAATSAGRARAELTRSVSPLHFSPPVVSVTVVRLPSVSHFLANAASSAGLICRCAHSACSWTRGRRSAPSCAPASPPRASAVSRPEDGAVLQVRAHRVEALLIDVAAGELARSRR